MYNFRMSKKEQNEILNYCNFSELEKFIFNNLVEEKSRQEVYELAKKEYNMSASTVNRAIKRLTIKLGQKENENVIYTHKVYVHKFPNGKKYVGVCQSCEDRWRNGQGYAYNKKMYDDIKKYGWENIEHKILLETSDNELAYKLERILIDEMELVKNGYNNE
ncbi:hypothetical protein IKS57_01730 [bacterium]|nr:hypothetical protein [bacterium]